MNAQIGKKMIMVTCMALLFSLEVQADEKTNHSPPAWDLEKTAGPNGHHALVHPFLVHMGMPDEPGELSTRINSFEERVEGASSGTYGFHIETGIIDRLGLHLRNDGIRTHANTELMLQYAVWRSESKLSGISLIGELEFPTGPTTTTAKGLFGFSFAYVLAPIFAVNSTVHYSPRDKETEWEIGFAGRLTEKIFPILEFNGEMMESEDPVTNILAGLKFKIHNGHAIGVGYQMAATSHREFDSQLLLQADLNFH